MLLVPFHGHSSSVHLLEVHLGIRHSILCLPMGIEDWFSFRICDSGGFGNRGWRSGFSWFHLERQGHPSRSAYDLGQVAGVDEMDPIHA